MQYRRMSATTTKSENRLGARFGHESSAEPAELGNNGPTCPRSAGGSPRPRTIPTALASPSAHTCKNQRVFGYGTRRSTRDKLMKSVRIQTLLIANLLLGVLFAASNIRAQESVVYSEGFENTNGG